MRYLGGHLGPTVSALLDGQLDPASSERAWGHVHACESCRRQVEREGWVKTRLARMAPDEAPPAQLLGSLYGLGSAPRPTTDEGGAAAWAAVHEIEQRGRGRRRTGLAVAGAGSVSLAVIGLASLTGSTLGIGAPAGPATSALTRSPNPTTSVVAPLARVPGRLPVSAPRRSADTDPRATGSARPTSGSSAGRSLVPSTDPTSRAASRGEDASGLRP